MMKQLLALTTAATLLTGVALANTPAKDAGKKMGAKPTTAKLVEVKVCPMTGEAVKGKGAGSEVVGKYNVHFCCGGCQPAFDKLSKADKDKKIAAVLNKKPGKSTM